jgi:AcrR family transcriptional regulator
MTASEERKRDLFDFKRLHILRTAETVFGAHGLEGTSLRAIAKAAGYSAPAIYTYYKTKEEVYGDIIARSLDELFALMSDAADKARSAQRALADAAFAYYAYYRDNPHQLDLGFHLFSGAAAEGVSPEIDRELNRRFKQSVDLLAQLYRRATGASPRESTGVAAEAMVHAVGIVMMGTGRRLALLRQDGDAMMREYVERLIGDQRAVSTATVSLSK